MQDPFSLCIPISNKKAYTWCNVLCNVWLCMDEMSEHLNSFFIWICFILLSSFLVLTNEDCKYHAPSHADECHNQPYQCNMQPLCPDMPLINFELLTLMSIFFCECKHFIKTWCKLKFSFFDTNALTKMQTQNFNSWCKMPLFRDANASFHDTSVLCRDARWKRVLHLIKALERPLGRRK